MRTTVCRRIYQPLSDIAGVVLCALLMSNCGGSGGSSGGNPPPAPDFSLVVPANASVQQGSSTPINVGVNPTNGFSSQVNVTISGMPTGVTATPSQFTLASGGQQQVVLAASSTAAVGTPTLEVTGVSGALTHAAPVILQVSTSQGEPASTARVRYVETDIQWDSGFLQFFPQPLIIFDPGTKRFFVSNTSLNRVDVVDATTEKKIAEIQVPGAFVGDESPDHTTIYLGTQVGDIYQIDPVGMKVIKRIPSVLIGPSGFPVYEIRILASGQLAMLGGQGGIPEVDGYSVLGIWDPSTNALQEYGSFYGNTQTPNQNPPICGTLENIAQIALTADRTKILLSSNASDGTLCLFDPVTLKQQLTQANDSGPIFVPPDGKEIVIGAGAQVTIYDSNTLTQIDQFPVGDGTGFYHYGLSLDGNTIFAINQLQGHANPVYQWRTHQLAGWLTTFNLDDEIETTQPTPIAADATGLIACAIGHGIEFLDGAALQPNPPGIFLFGDANVVQPTFGPVQGGTQAVITGVQITDVQDVFFGSGSATVTSTGASGIGVTSPAGSPGPVDVGMNASDGSFLLLPNGYSYGPSIVEVRPDESPAQGGGSGTIFGYGFGSGDVNGTAPGLQVSVGGQQATITQYLPQPFSQALVPYPFPLEAVEYMLPPGNAGLVASVEISNSAGSATVSQAITYLPALQQFPLTGAQLFQGVYDPKRDVYYFTDAQQIRVFSKTKGQWLTSISQLAGAQRLWGISLSPDGSKLVVTDAGANLIFLLDPDTPNTVQKFTVPNTGLDQDQQPGGLAVTDSGQVYFATFNLLITGQSGLHKLDTTSGKITDFQNVPDTALGADASIRVLLTNDNSRIFVNDEGGVFSIDTTTDTLFFNPALSQGADYELTLSSNNTWMSATEVMMDTNLNPESTLAYVDRDIWNVSAVYGEKLSADGNLLFLPLLNGLDVVDGKLGILLHRLALPVTLSANYDALVSDGKDDVLVAITGQTGDGIAVIDLTSLAEPPPSTRAAASQFAPLPRKKAANSVSAISVKGRETSTSGIDHRPTSPRHISISSAVSLPRR